MADTSQFSHGPLFITTWSNWTAAVELRAMASQTPASLTWPSANLAIYIPFAIPFPYPVNRAFWGNGSGTLANADIGIYSVGGSRLWSAGHDNSDTAITQSGASALQYVTATTPLLLSPGRYYLAVSYSGTTNVAYGSTPSSQFQTRFAGALQQASSVPLPASATFATNSNPAWPLAGITKTTSGF